jgi:hypothetical protein
LKVKTKPTALPTFSINVSVDGEKLSGSGKFNLSGHGTLNKKIARKKSGLADLDLYVDLDLDNQMVTGEVMTTNPLLWYAKMRGDQAVWTPISPATNYTGLDYGTNYPGLFTMVVTGAVGSGSSPSGDGYATVKIVATNGLIKMSGNLGDGEKWSQTGVGLSKDGLWPLFAMMNKDTVTTKIFKGMIMGWVTVEPGEESRDLTATNLNWFRQPLAIGLYQSGFTNYGLHLLGSKYHVPYTGERAIVLANNDTNGMGRLTLDAEAGLTTSIVVDTNLLSPLPQNKFTVGANTNTVKLNNPTWKTGLFKGSFMHPVTADRQNLVGVILRDQNVARGFFKGPVSTETGSFLLEAQP